MRRGFSVALLASFLLCGAADSARAQYYPWGYRGWGWRGWGMGWGAGRDPGADYMRGVGSFYRDKGIYDIEEQQALSIRADTIAKWNKAHREMRLALEREKQEKQLQKNIENLELQRERAILNGTRLNQLMDRILAYPSSELRGKLSQTNFEARDIRDIPFEIESEAVTVCLDQMTSRDGWPARLLDDRFDDLRDDVEEAVDAALKEDADGSVSAETSKKLRAAIRALREKFEKEVPDYSPDYVVCDEFLRSLGSLTHMLRNREIERVLSKLEAYKGGTLADLAAFVQTYNLRFAPATTSRQKELYRSLTQTLEQVAPDTEEPAQELRERSVETSGRNLSAAAREAFKNMSWKDLYSASQP